MVKIGNIVFFHIALLFCSNLLYADSDKKITLQLLDANGDRLDKIGKNIPCVVRLTMQNISQAKEPNFIPGFQHAKVQKGNTSRSHMISSHGSQQTVTVEYVVVVDKEQEITFGPYSADGVTSNSVTCKVVSTSGHVHKDKKADLVMMKVHVPQKKYVVGQKVLVQISVWQQKHEQFSDVGHDQLNCAGCKMGKTFVVSPQGVVEKINDIEYIKQEFLVELYPQSAGTYTIPALQGYYIQNYHASMYSFWLPQPQQKVFYANPVEFKVEDLPKAPSGKKIEYIGTLDGMMLKLSTHTTQVGKAITATLWMQGDGNIENIEFPELQLSEDIKMYPGNSKTSYVTNTMNAQRIFEYVLQCTRPGEFDFPVQEFTYFDTQKWKYKTITFGEDISVVVEPGLHKVEVEKQIEKIDSEDNSEDELPLLLLKSSCGDYMIVPHGVIVFLYWFIFLMMMLPLVYIYCIPRRFVKKVYSLFLWGMFLRNIRKNSVQNIRGSWQKYIESAAVLLKINLSTQDIYALELVHTLGFSEKDVQEWKRFYAFVLQATYDNFESNVKTVDLQQQSVFWVNRFKRLVWQKI